MKVSRRFKLQIVISGILTLSILFTAAIWLFASFQVNKKSLETSYLKNNYWYAKKLASETNTLLSSMDAVLQTVADQAAYHSGKEMQEDVAALMDSREPYFNSVFIVDQNRIVQAVSPSATGISIGQQLDSSVSQRAVTLKKPFISTPYRGITERLIVLVSYPIFDGSGGYKGFVGGTIYLEGDNILSNMLEKHYYENGSYVYVVDQTGHLIFHPNKQRLSEDVSENKIVAKVLKGEEGFGKVVNTEGKTFLAGYALESKSGWGIVSQTPLSITNEPICNMIVRSVKLAFPFVVLVWFFAWWISRRISRPLQQLASYTEETTKTLGQPPVPIPRVRTNIYEIQQLFESVKYSSQHVHSYLSQLQEETQTDGLTGIANRKTFDFVMKDLMHNDIPFSLILLDIDHFKKINDTYGHPMGDEVIKFLATVMPDVIREGDMCFRYGGEEFCIIVLYSDEEGAGNIAERLRQTMEQSISPAGIAATLSLGISAFPKHAVSPNELVKLADKALYQSKQEGRNRVTIFSQGFSGHV
ncbi:sensor domain-containing diguanylate cyclase [Ectobacillus funiculus]|uniref:Diguanylate cyclase n=1 Tax=Ectobacillus funiculus TaxID=137993 RepID=A0ABV5WK14_9BACI